jgi:hypothetical protein
VSGLVASRKAQHPSGLGSDDHGSKMLDGRTSALLAAPAAALQAAVESAAPGCSSGNQTATRAAFSIVPPNPAELSRLWSAEFDRQYAGCVAALPALLVRTALRLPHNLGSLARVSGQQQTTLNAGSDTPESVSLAVAGAVASSLADVLAGMCSLASICMLVLYLHRVQILTWSHSCERRWQ